MSEANAFVRIDDPNQPIYRIFPFWSFQRSLRLKQLELVNPSKWDDPFELLIERSWIVYRKSSPRKEVPLRESLKPAYAQCWSRSQESDALWRAYSKVQKHAQENRNIYPSEEGVQVRSTPRKLLETLINWSPLKNKKSCFIGSVNYMSTENIMQYIANQIGRLGGSAFSSGEDRAKLLFLKRPAFKHEEEIRLVYIEHRDVPTQEIVMVPMEPNSIFEEVTFDPRLEIFERREHEQIVKNLGYTGHFGESMLYQNIELQIFMDDSPP